MHMNARHEAWKHIQKQHIALSDESRKVKVSVSTIRKLVEQAYGMGRGEADIARDFRNVADQFERMVKPRPGPRAGKGPPK